MPPIGRRKAGPTPAGLYPGPRRNWGTGREVVMTTHAGAPDAPPAPRKPRRADGPSGRRDRAAGMLGAFNQTGEKPPIEVWGGYPPVPRRAAGPCPTVVPFPTVARIIFVAPRR